MNADKAKKLMDAATQGEWTVGFGGCNDIDVFDDGGLLVAACDADEAAFIAALPEITKAYIEQSEYVKRLEEENDMFRAVLNEDMQ